MDFLVIGTLWFWLFAIAWFVLVTFCVEKEESSGWGALITSAAFVALLFFFGSREPVVSALKYIVHNPLSILLMGVLYLFCGSVWSIVKWYIFLKETRRKQLDNHRSWNEQRDPKDQRPWKPDIPKAKRHKSTIMMWMSWWPFSLIWTAVDDPIRKAFRNIYYHLEKTYDRMAERIMKTE